MTTTESTSNTECPTCGRDDFAGRTGMKIHHNQAHGSPVGDVRSECANCGETIKVYGEKAQNADRNFCDIECKSEWQSGKDPRELSEKAWHDAKLVRDLYKHEGMSAEEIGNKLGCSDMAVLGTLHRADVDVKKGPSPEHPELKNREWLHEKYVEEGESALEISEELGCHPKTVYRRMEECGISRRPSSREQTPDLLESPTQLREEYHTDGVRAKDIADRIGCAKSTVLRWLSVHGIETKNPRDHYDRVSAECGWCGSEISRTPSRMRATDIQFCSVTCQSEWQSDARSGVNHPSWIGGERHYGRGWNKNKKNAVRVRDQARCQGCGLPESESFEEYGTALHVHHITPAREIDDPKKRNGMTNLITLCQTCHPRWEKMAPLRPDTEFTAD